MIEEAFDKARNCQYKIHVMLLDEIDSIMLKKKGMLNVAERTNALLSELDGVKDSSHIIVIATTNNIKNIDPAVLSRFSDVIVLEPPNYEERLQLIKMYISSLPLNRKVDEEAIARNTEGFTGRNFKDIGIKGIEKYSLNKKKISAEWITMEISKYVHRAGLVKQYMYKEIGELKNEDD